MIGWGQVFYGAALTTVVAAVILAAVKHERSLDVLVPALAAAFVGPLAVWVSNYLRDQADSRRAG